LHEDNKLPSEAVSPNIKLIKYKTKKDEGMKESTDLITPAKL
jgi:hypothetical protein